MKNLYTLTTALALTLGVDPELHAQPGKPAFRLQRDQESYAYLGKDSLFAVRSSWEHLKFVPLNARRTAYLSVGGEIRMQYEYLINAKWGEGPEKHDGYLLQRYQLHTDWQLGTYLLLFGHLEQIRSQCT